MSRKCLYIIFLVGLLLLSSLPNISAQNNAYSFERITNNDGLSQGAINCILQDSKGFMWFGTKDGVNKYDGENFVVFKKNFQDTATLAGNTVLTFSEDKNKNLWIGCIGGLSILDLRSETFHTPALYQGIVSELRTGIVRCIAFQDDKIAWIGTRGMGLYKVDLLTGEFRHFFPIQISNDDIPCTTILKIVIAENGDPYMVSNSRGLIRYDIESDSFIKYTPEKELELDVVYEIHNIKLGKDNTIWMSDFYQGLYKFDIRDKSFKSYLKFNKNGKEFEVNLIRDFLVDDSIIWMGTQGFGLMRANIVENTIDIILYDPTNENSLSHNGILSLSEDAAGLLWVGTNGKGINLLKSTQKKFITYKSIEVDGEKQEFMSVRGIFKQDKTLWVSGYGGVYCFDMENDKFRLTPFPVNVYAIKPNPLDASKLWIGDEGSGLYKLNKSDLKLTKLEYSDKLAEGLIYGSNVFSLLPDGNYLWVGTGRALNKYNVLTGEIDYYYYDPQNSKSIANGMIKAIYKTTNGEYWVGTNIGGLCFFNGVDNEFERYRYDLNDPSSLSNNAINAITEDSKGNIWVSTNMGLNRFIKTSQSFIAYTEKDGLPNNVIYAALEDPNGNLWLSSNKGITRFNPVTLEVRNFDVQDGLQGNEFNAGAYFKASDGEMFFGGVNGITRFYPSKIVDNEYKPFTVFTYLFKSTPEGTVKTNVSYKDEIEMSSNDAIFSIGFAALNYYKSQKNQYKYQISGLESGQTNWIDLGYKNTIDFVGLDPGDYQLTVMGSNNDGVWSENGKTIDITIVPLFWQTNWFRYLIILIIVLIVTIIIRNRITSIQRQKRKLSKLVDRQTQELTEANKELSEEVNTRKEVEVQLRDANQTKDKFFSILGHDLKNPMSSLMGLSKILYEEPETLNEEEKEEFVKSISESSETLYKLVENLLNWSRVQSGKIDIKPEFIELDEIVIENFNLLKQNAEKKEIQLLNLVQNNTIVWADKNMITTILRNFISNAIKFTPRKGKIMVFTRNEGDLIRVNIKDNGVGIDKNNIKKLFKLSEKFKTEGTENESGTGLGLLICKEFIQKNKGGIEVESKPGKGSIFSFTLLAKEWNP